MPISPPQTSPVALRLPEPELANGQGSPQQNTFLCHGFTLVEVLVALVVLALLSAVTARVLQGSLQARQIQQDEHAALGQRADSFSRQLSGEREEPVVTLERLENDDN